MLLLLDVGNTNTVLGVFAKSMTDSAPPPKYDKLVANWRVTTRAVQTVDEYGVLFRNLFSMEGLEPKDIGGIVISSVVPPLDSTLRRGVLASLSPQHPFFSLLGQKREAGLFFNTSGGGGRAPLGFDVRVPSEWMG